MLYLFRLLTLLINIDQETILNWFGVENLPNREPSTAISFSTFRLIIEGLWEKVRDGLTLADIENVIFFILIIRFVVLALRYDLKTSFYITCIGLFAGYLWYTHLIDLISMYKSVLLKLPFLNKLAIDIVELRSLQRQMVLTDLKLGENAHWYNPGQVLYDAFRYGIVDVDPETGLKYYIDPISMFISNLEEPTKSNILPIYYKIYKKFLPKVLDFFSKFWTQLSGVAGYAIITRVGKRYCPYLIRWHWTFLLLTAVFDQILVYFIYRVSYFQTFVLIPQTKSYYSSVNPNLSNLILQINSLNIVIAAIILIHIGFTIFALLHAVCGQYFYIPFFVENTELHIGPRPKNSIYSGGLTSWQNPREKERKLDRLFPKLWYGWFGRGTKDIGQYDNVFKRFLKKIVKKLRKRLKRQFRR